MKGVIVGFGNMGQTHFQRYLKLGADIAGVVEIDRAKGNLVREKGLEVYTALPEVPSMEKIDFIDICTPTPDHCRLIEQAIDYGKAICVEKPAVLNRREVQRLRGRDCTRVFVAEVEQFNPSLQGFVTYSGKPRRIDISREVNLELFWKGKRPWVLEDRLSGGIALDLMIHDITTLVQKYGKPKIRSVLGARKIFDAVDDVVATLQYDGFDSVVHSSWAGRNAEKPIIAKIVIEDVAGKKTVISCDDYLIGDKKADSEDAFFLELKAFLESVRTGRTPYPFSVYLDSVELCLDIRDRIRVG